MFELIIIAALGIIGYKTITRQPRESVSTRVSSSVSSSVSSRIFIDAGEVIGPIPPLFRTGVFIAHSPEFPPDQLGGIRFFKEHKIGAVEIQKPFLSPQLFPPESTLDGYKDRLANSDTIKWIKEIDRNGGEVIFNLMGVPEYLRSIKYDAHSQPNNYVKWAELIRATVDYINNNLNIKAKYVVWDEPELFYGGTEANYYELYKYSVIGAKQADVNAKIGGPASSNVMASFKGSSFPMLHNFIRYCNNTSVLEVGLSKLPIDFIVWHDFGFLTTAKIKQDVAIVRNWLNESDYSPDTELINGSWNSWVDFPSEGSVERDANYLSAYILHALLAMDEAGIKKHLFFTLFENWQSKEGESMYGEQILKKVENKQSEFFGGFGLYTRNYISKPACNTFKALGMLEGNRLVAKSDDPFLSVLVTGNDEKLFLLISNFLPHRKMIGAYAGSLLLERGYTKENLKKYGISQDILKNIVQGRVSIDRLNLPEKEKKDFKDIITLTKMAGMRQTSNVNISVDWTNLYFTGDVKYEKYIISSGEIVSVAVRNKIAMIISNAEKEADQETYKYLSGIWSPQEIQSLQEMSRRGMKPKDIFEKLPLNKRKELNEALKLRELYVFNKIDNVNNWPAVSINKIEDKIVKVAEQYKENIMVKPYEVYLIVLS